MKYTSFLSLLFFITFLRAVQELPLVILIPAYNNAAYVRETLNSVAMQKYDNYRIIYIDDCSTDNSPQLVAQCINSFNWHDKITFIQNTQRYRKMRNIYYAINYLCDDDEIVVFIDCDDKLAHDKVFALINEKFSCPDVWFMYGSDKAFPESEVHRWGISPTYLSSRTSKETIEKNNFRTSTFVYMHIRAFRAPLYKAVKIEDLLTDKVPGYEGLFYPACNDYANIYPMLEMAGYHIDFNPELVYLYNAGSPLNGFKIDRSIMIASGGEIKSKPPYGRLSALPINRLKLFEHAQADCIIFSKNPTESERLIDQVQNSLRSIEKIFIIYEPNTSTETKYDDLRKKYPNIVWINYAKESCAQSLTIINQHCLLLDDTCSIPSIDLTQCIIELERTSSFCCYLTQEGLPHNIRKQEITQGLAVFSFKHNPSVTYYSTHCCLYRTHDLQELFPEKKECMDKHLKQWYQRRSIAKVALIKT